MTDQLEAIKDRIATLAIIARGSRSRERLIEVVGMNLSTYSDFETRKRWPRAINLRRIEKALQWTHGAIDEALASGLNPQQLNLEHLQGTAKFTISSPEQEESHTRTPTLRDYSSAELAFELVRRAEHGKA
ncbi:hypothetical protein [Arthrobacter rhombi]|uniref:hypothetical protein n=1 Tax=Arthrobacter rhombi TaxID=71253 RepID=UPI003FD3F9D0